MPSPVPQDLFFRDVVCSYVAAPRFLRRDWMARAVETQIHDPGCRFVLITAEPGAGKSALVAQLAADHVQWPVFFIRRDQRTSLGEVGARSFLLRIGLQLAAIHPDLFSLEQVRIEVEQRVGTSRGDVIGAEIERIRASPFHSTVVRIRQQIDSAGGSVGGVKIGEWVTDPRLLSVEDLQQMALFDPARALLRLDPSQRIVILVDALDELRYHDDEGDLLDWLSNCPPLPTNVSFVLTSRPTHGPLRLFLDKRGSQVSLLPIDAADPRVREDLRAYGLTLLAQTEVSEALTQIGRDRDTFLKDLIEKAEGNIGYLSALGRAFDQARAGEEQRSLLVELLSLKRLPDDIQGLYGFFLHLIQHGPGRKDIRVADTVSGKVSVMDAWSAVYQPILALLVVTFEPLTIDQVHALADTSAGRPQVAQALDWLDQFLDHVGNARRLYHQTLVEFLTAESTQRDDSLSDLYVEADAEHARLVHLVDASTIWAASEDAKESCRRDYFTRHYIEHLFAARAWDLLYATIDTGAYGRGKLRFDSSTLLYSRDLDLAIRAVSRPEKDETARVRRLPRLWRYQLLRATLSNFADALPAAAYTAMAAVGRAAKAADLAQLITQADRQALVLVGLAAAHDPHVPAEQAHELLQRGFELAARVDNEEEREALLLQLLQIGGPMLKDVPPAVQAAARVATTLSTAGARAKALGTLIRYVESQVERDPLAQTFFELVNAAADSEENDALYFICAIHCSDVHELETAHAAVTHIRFAGLRMDALRQIATQELASGDSDAAEASRKEAAALIDVFPVDGRRARALAQLARLDLALGRADRAASTVGAAFDQLGDADASAPDIMKTLTEMAEVLKQVADTPRLEATVRRIHDLATNELKGRIETAGHGYSVSIVASNAARALAALDECDRALQIIGELRPYEREPALLAVARSFVHQRQWNRAQDTVEQIKRNAQSLRMRIVVTVEDELTEESNYDVADRALIDLALGLAKDQQWERARTTAETIGGVEARLDALSQLANLLQEAGHGDAATALVQQVEFDSRVAKFSDQRDQAVADSVGLLTATRRWTEAMAAAGTIGDERVRALSQQSIAHALIEEGDVATAQRVLSQISDAAVCAGVALELAQKAAKTGDRDDTTTVIQRLLVARDFARRTPDMEKRAESLRSIALAFGDLNTGAGQEAMATMEEVVVTLGKAPPFGVRPSPWCATIAAFAQLGNWDGALQIGRGLLAFEAFDGCSAFCDLSDVAREQGDAERAGALIDTARDHVAEITFVPMQLGMRATIAEAYARQGRMAEALSDALVTPAARSDSMVRIAAVLAKSGDVPAAKKLLSDLPEGANADSAKVAIVDACLKASQADEARQAAAAIADTDTRAMQMLAVTTALLKSERRDAGYAAIAEILELSRSLYVGTAVTLVRELVACLVSAGELSRAIAVVEERWLAAATHTELLPCLRIVEPFVTLEPDIAEGISQSFGWIDKMLAAT